ncbi:MAG: hypothetical protein WBM07_13750 [Chitinivibrionales bacterium]
MNYFKLAVLTAVIFVTGCAPTILVMKDFQDGSFSFGQIKNGSAVKLYVSDRVNLMEFKKAFVNEYHSDRQFAAILRGQMADSMKSRLNCSVSIGDSLRDITPLLSSSLDQNSIDQARAVFEASGDDYLFIVRSVDVANSVSSSAPMYMAGGGAGGGGMFVGGGSSESCVVTIHADLWNAKEKKKLLSCSAIGQSTVFMFFFGAALKDAVGESVRHLVKYLSTGATY